MENITEKQVRKLAEDETGLDLSHPVGRKLVLSMISAFLDGNGDKAEEEVESEEDDEEKTKKQKKKKKTTKAKKVIEAHVCFDVRFFCFATMA